MIIYNENNNRCCALVQIQKKKKTENTWSERSNFASKLFWNCSFSAEFHILTILRFLLKDRRHCFGKLTGTSPLLTSTKTEQSTWRLRVICVKLPTTAHMLPSRRPKSFQPDKKQPLTPITQQQSRQSSVSLYSPSARLTSCSWEEHTGAPTAPAQHRRLWPTFKLGPSALNDVYWKVLWKHSDRHAVMCPPTSEPNKKKLKKKKKMKFQRTSVLRTYEPCDCVGRENLTDLTQARGHHDHHDKPTMFEGETQQFRCFFRWRLVGLSYESAIMCT